MDRDRYVHIKNRIFLFFHDFDAMTVMRRTFSRAYCDIHIVYALYIHKNARKSFLDDDKGDGIKKYLFAS